MGFVGQGGLGFVVDVAYASSGQCDQTAGDDVAREVHARRVGLDHCCRTVDVNDESGQEIAFAVDEAEGIVVGAYQSERLP